MSVGDQLGLDDNSELLDRARSKWPDWVAADSRLGVVAVFDDLRAWLPLVDRDASDEVLLALAMLAAPDGGDDIAAAFPDIPPRRLNSALSYLEGAKAIEARRYLGNRQWTYAALTVSDRTLRFAKNRS